MNDERLMHTRPKCLTRCLTELIVISSRSMAVHKHVVPAIHPPKWLAGTNVRWAPSVVVLFLAKSVSSLFA